MYSNSDTSGFYDVMAIAGWWWLMLVLLACPISTAIVAGSKGRNAFGWFFLGLLFGPFGLFAAIGVVPIDEDAINARAGRPSLKKICTACREVVWRKAVVCPYCQTGLEVDEEALNDGSWQSPLAQSTPSRE
jgi:hypothetical protein